MSSGTPRRCTVVVLGPLGRSPRMLYHARSLADTGAEVDLVGYGGHRLPRAIAVHPRVHVHGVWAPASAVGTRRSRLGFLVYAVWRVLRQTLNLARVLLVRVPRPSAVLVQNPPAVPTLAVALAVCRLRGARLVVDWHNLGHAMVGLTLGTGHPAVRLAAAYERLFGRRADAHLCVSRALGAELAARWGITDATVLYDRPADLFVPTPPAERRALLARLGNVLHPTLAAENAPRPALVVCPSGWTADEDYEMLLAALVALDGRLAGGTNGAPRVVLALTGDGALRARYAARLAGLALEAIAVRTLWLDITDYASLLGAADLGLSLHRSTSGLDLPMKVADMFGAGLPVCALDYAPCIREQIRDGETGLLFADATALADQLARLLSGFPGEAAELARLRAGVATRERQRWPAAWEAAARPVLLPEEHVRAV